MVKMNEVVGDPQFNIIAAGTTIEGNIKTNTSCRIDGAVKGNIECKAQVIIGQSGILEGDIQCDSIDIAGRVKANITAKDIISLRATAVLAGDIVSSKLAIEPGANFIGNCRIQNGNGGAPIIPKDNGSEKK